MLFYWHDSGLEHDTGLGHPERPQRLTAIRKAVEAADVMGLEWREAPRGTTAQAALVHVDHHIERVLGATPVEGLAHLDADTVVSPGSVEAALYAVGAACAAVDAVLADETSRAFCAMRPPGHHAEPDRAMGFCLFNQIAIAARHARKRHGVGRVAIFDFDVHHGNGTQAAFWDDPSVLYLSTHQWPLYPGTGAKDERGAHDNIVNVPLASGTESTRFKAAVDALILPRIEAFKPDLIMISAGFDAHRADPLASLALVEEDFAAVTRDLVTLAERLCGGRVVSVLEGGYDLTGLSRSVVAHLNALVDL